MCQPHQELDYETLLTDRDVHLQLTKYKPNKAPGLDGILGRVLKSCALELTSVLHSLFIRSLCTSTVSGIWKTSTVIRVPKKSHPSEPNHYRPVCLTSIIMKCFEKLVQIIILPYVVPTARPPPVRIQTKERYRRCSGHSPAPSASTPGLPP